MCRITERAQSLGRHAVLLDGSCNIRWLCATRGRVTAETHTIDGEAYTLGYAYDSADRVLRVVYPAQGAETVNVAYTA